MNRYKVVGIERRSKLMLAMVLKESDTKQEVYTEEGGKISIPGKKILWSSNTFLEADNQKSMKEGLIKYLSTEEEITDLATLWEFLEGEEDKYSFRDLVELYHGDYSESRALSLFKVLKEDHLYFKINGQELTRNASDTVEANTRRLTAEKKRKEQEDSFLKWFTEYHPEAKEREEPGADILEMIELAKEFALRGEDRASASSKRVSSLLALSADDLLITLENKGLIEKDINECIYRSDLSRTFPQNVLDETEELLQKDTSWDGRRILSDIWSIAIDSKDTEEVDDAISVHQEDNGKVLGIHIADVDATVKEGTALDRNAQNRFATLYFPDERIPVFPSSLVQERLTLKEDSLRPTVSGFFYFDPEGKLSRYHFERTALKLGQRLTYEETNDPKWQEHELFSWLEKTAISLREERLSQGALVTDFPDVKIKVENGNVDIKVSRSNTSGHLVVSECMILFNGKFGENLKEKNIPAIFRGQAKSGQNIEELDKDDPLYPLKIRWSMGAASLSLQAFSHATLGLSSYTQATSPIRRYSDLVVHRQFFYSSEEAPYYDLPNLQAKLAMFERSEKTIKVTESERRSFWLYKYLKLQKNRVFQGIISRLFDNNRVMVFIPEIWQEFPFKLDNPREAKEGNLISLKIQGASPRKRKAHFSMVSSLSSSEKESSSPPILQEAK